MQTAVCSFRRSTLSRSCIRSKAWIRERDERDKNENDDISETQ